MVTLIFTSDLWSGQMVQFLLNLSSFVSGFEKNVICFVVRLLEIPKIEFQKSDIITHTWFVGHCTAKNKDVGPLAWNCVPPLLAHSYVIYIFRFWTSSEFSILWYFRKIEIFIFVRKKISEVRESCFVVLVIWHLLVFVACVLLWNPSFRKPLKVGRFWDPKSRDMTSP